MNVQGVRGWDHWRDVELGGCVLKFVGICHLALKLNFCFEVVFYSSKHAQHNATYIIRGFWYLNFNLHSVDLKRVNLHVWSHRVFVGRDDVDGVVPNKLCDVDVPRLSRPYGFSNKMTEGKASQVVGIDPSTRPALVAVTFEQMQRKATVTSSTLRIVRTDTAELTGSGHAAVGTRLRNCNILATISKITEIRNNQNIQ